MTITLADEGHLRRAIGLAWQARRNGNMPFGALLTDHLGSVVLEAENTSISEANPLAHAETNLLREAVVCLGPSRVAPCTLYTSCEPCAMCAGTAFWAGVRRVVYALDLPRFEAIRDDPAKYCATVRAADVLSSGGAAIALEGPALVPEAEAVHDGYWS